MQFVNAVIKAKGLYYFIFIAVCLVLFNFLIQKLFLTEYVYTNTYSAIMDDARIHEMFNQVGKYQAWGYFFLPIILLLKIFYNSIWVTSATVLDGKSYDFGTNFSICLKTEIIFILLLIARLVILVLSKNVTTVQDINSIPGSLLDFLNYNSIPIWGLYALQTINIWEALYCVFGAIIFAQRYQVTMRKAFLLFSLPYLIGVLVLIILFTFLTLQIS